MNGDRIRILLVDDQALFREGLRTLLKLIPDFEIVGEAGDGREALQLASRHQPDVVLMDLRMPGMDGVEATRQLRARPAAPQVLVLTTFDHDSDVFAALSAGAIGYLLKDVQSERLADAVRCAARGQSILQPSVAAKVVGEFARMQNRQQRRTTQPLVEPLSARELEVLEQLAQGRSNKEIAVQLHIAEGTVKNHIGNLLAKLAVQDRTQAALRARDLGLL